MTKILLIAYYFPPLGGAGIMRPLQLMRRLPDFGFDVHVLTVKDVLYNVYEPELLIGLDESKIHRAGSYDPQRVLYRLGMREIQPAFQVANQRLKSHFFPDNKKGWIGPASRLGEKLHNKHGFKLILSTSPPVSAHFVAKILSRDLGIPWVADFRDFWEGKKPEDQYESGPEVAKVQGALHEISRQASTVVAVNRSIADYLVTDEVIPNAYDDQLARLWKAPSSREKFVIGLLGTFTAIQPVEPLAQVIAGAVAKDATLQDRIEVVQVGSTDQNCLRRTFAKYGLEKLLRVHGLLPREKSIEIMSESSLFYLALESTLADCVVPGRIFDLIVSGRPVLAYASPEGEVATYLRHVCGGHCFTDYRVDSATEHLRTLMQSWSDGTLLIEPRPSYSTPHSWSERIKQYAALLNGLVKSSAK